MKREHRHEVHAPDAAAHRDAAAEEPCGARAAAGDGEPAREGQGRVGRADGDENGKRHERSFVATVHAIHMCVTLARGGAYVGRGGVRFEYRAAASIPSWAGMNRYGVGTRRYRSVEPRGVSHVDTLHVTVEAF